MELRTTVLRSWRCTIDSCMEVGTPLDEVDVQLADLAGTKLRAHTGAKKLKTRRVLASHVLYTLDVSCLVVKIADGLQYCTVWAALHTAGEVISLSSPSTLPPISVPQSEAECNSVVFWWCQESLCQDQRRPHPRGLSISAHWLFLPHRTSYAMPCSARTIRHPCNSHCEVEKSRLF
jgi:hypothetical protein